MLNQLGKLLAYSGKMLKIKQNSQKSRLLLKTTIIKAANAVEDPLDALENYKTYQIDCSSLLNVSCARALSTDESTQNEVFELVKLNMEQLYQQSSWGWRNRRKKAELTDKDSRYLLLRDNADELAAVSHFRFLVDEDSPVLYCYEVQVHPNFQRKGIGKFMMHILFSIAQNLKLTKIMLTVFKNNSAALMFYVNKLGFELDETSPRDSNESYLILSKKTVKGI